MSRATIATQPMMPSAQVSGPPIEPSPAADLLEAGVKARHGRAVGHVIDDAANGQETAKRNDERRNADVGDDEPLETADEGADADPDQQGDDPAEGELHADPDRR